MPTNTTTDRSVFAERGFLFPIRVFDEAKAEAYLASYALHEANGVIADDNPGFASIASFRGFTNSRRTRPYSMWSKR
jgi:hypothetical protein